MRLLLEMPFVLVKRRRRRASRKGQSNNLTHIVSNAVGMSTIAVQKGKNPEMDEVMSRAHKREQKKIHCKTKRKSRKVLIFRARTAWCH
jgi:hypothetical protein